MNYNRGDIIIYLVQEGTETGRILLLPDEWIEGCYVIETLTCEEYWPAALNFSPTDLIFKLNPHIHGNTPCWCVSTDEIIGLADPIYEAEQVIRREIYSNIK
jgi:hypothetical protein